MTRDARRIALTTLAVLLCADGLLIALHVLRETHALPAWGLPDLLASWRWSVEADGGVAEKFQYVKEVFACALLILLAVRGRGRTHWAWAAVFAYLWLDDWRQIHENVGEWMAGAFGFPAVLGLRTIDLGEIAVSAIAGSLLLAGVGVAYLRGDSGFRRFTHRMLLLLAALFAVGVLADLIVVPLGKSAAAYAMSVVEDGGEMVVMSAFFALIVFRAQRLGLLRRPHPEAAPAFEAEQEA